MSLSAKDFQRVATLVTRFARPLLLTHARLDGDAIGCLVAMDAVLRAQGIDPVAAVFEPVEPRFEALTEGVPLCTWDERPGIEIGNALASTDGVLVLDTAARAQLGPADAWLRSCGRPVVVIDHHATRDVEAHDCLIDVEASAACLILFEWTQAVGWNLGARARDALFVGVATDTGWFRFSNTDARTLAAAARLVADGVAADRWYRALYHVQSTARVALRAAALGTLEMHGNGRVAVMSITPQMFQRTGAESADASELVNEPLYIRGVVASVLVVDEGTSVIRASLRSTGGIDVAKVAQRFGGGGHARAAGARLSGSLDHVKAQVLAAMQDALTEDPGRA